MSVKSLICYLLLCTFSVILATECEAQWQCTPEVSENYNFATCQGGQCFCLNENGFLGNATASSKCRCDQGVFWDEESTPYCVDLGECGRLKNKLVGMSAMTQLRELNVTAAGSYHVQGGFFNSRINTFSSIGNTQLPSSFAIDVENRKIYFNHIVNIHVINDAPDDRGHYSYFVIQLPTGVTCYHSNYSYTDQVDNWKREAHVANYIDYRGERVSSFVGMRNDHHTACLGNLGSSTEIDERGVISRWSWHVRMTVAGNPNAIIHQNYWIDSRNAVFGTPNSALFHRPVQCATSVDICQFTSLF